MVALLLLLLPSCGEAGWAAPLSVVVSRLRSSRGADLAMGRKSQTRSCVRNSGRWTLRMMTSAANRTQSAIHNTHATEDKRNGRIRFSNCRAARRQLNRVSFETIAGAQASPEQPDGRVEPPSPVGGGSIPRSPPNSAENSRRPRSTAIESDRPHPVHPRCLRRGPQRPSSPPSSQASCCSRTPTRCAISAPKLAAAFGADARQSTQRAQSIENGSCSSPARCSRGNSSADIPQPATALTSQLPTGAYRGDQVEPGSAARRSRRLPPAPTEIRTKPEAPFQGAKQAVDLSQAEIIVSVGREHQEQKTHRTPPRLLLTYSAGESPHPAPSATTGWLPMERRSAPADNRQPQALPCPRISGAIQHIVG